MYFMVKNPSIQKDRKHSLFAVQGWTSAAAAVSSASRCHRMSSVFTKEDDDVVEVEMMSDHVVKVLSTQ